MKCMDAYTLTDMEHAIYNRTSNLMTQTLDTSQSKATSDIIALVAKMKQQYTQCLEDCSPQCVETCIPPSTTNSSNATTTPAPRTEEPSTSNTSNVTTTPVPDVIESRSDISPAEVRLGPLP